MGDIRYIFEKSKSGETVPAFCLPEGNLSLHSMIDPRREAQRLVSGLAQADFAVFLGLGGGFAPEAALDLPNTRVAVIDFDKESIGHLLKSKDYSGLLKNSRFSLIIDPLPGEIENFLLENFKPALYSSIKTIPLRTRTERDIQKFEYAAAAIQKTIKMISGDYSVQAHFGKRWFSNIIRNIKNVNAFHEFKPGQIKNAAVIAAGPSLDNQIKYLKELKSKKTFIISSDTALGSLLHNGIETDAVVSIDCQHISYYHFMGDNTRGIPLILDIASPPLLAGFSKKTVFFSGGHPLAKYVSNNWKRLPTLDTSGGNVTYSCLSLAETLGAQRITLFGADFSCIGCQSYARGTYINPYFANKQKRLSPIEAQMSALLYRSPFLPHEDGAGYRETSALRFYREKMEEKISAMSASVDCAPGFGAPVNLIKKEARQVDAEWKISSAEKERCSGADFLKSYMNDISGLPVFKSGGSYFDYLNEKQKQIFTTLLPYAAAVKKRNPELKQDDLIEYVKKQCVAEIKKVAD
ncbi:MAG: DUF115 domain-containing protein [Treponema sp.]|nr:DUF115 domain-containing protein [Treponema sp.]